MDRIKAADKWGQGYALGELLAASQLDMQWHTLPPGTPKQDVDKFEAQALKKTGTDFPNVPTRYRSSYFLHIWANGYASGYYAYQWTVMLDDDAYAWFTAHGGLTRANGQQEKINCSKVLNDPKYDKPVYPDDRIVVKKRVVW